MLTTIIMSLTATLSPVEGVTSADLFDADKIESHVVIEDRRKSTKKLSFERTIEDRRKSTKKLSFERVIEDRRKSTKKL